MTKNTITIPVELEGIEAAQQNVVQLVEKLKEARALTDALVSDLGKLTDEMRRSNAEDAAREMASRLCEVLRGTDTRISEHSQ